MIGKYKLEKAADVIYRAVRYRSKLTFTFMLTVYKEVKQVEWCLTQLRQVHPNIPIIMISDGDPDPLYKKIANRWRVKYILGNRLKLPEHGPRYWHRFIEEFLSSPSNLLIKIDPDTYLHRPFHYFLNADYFGTLDYEATPLQVVQGGCQVFSSKACHRLIESGVTKSPDYFDLAKWCKHPKLIESMRYYQSRSGLLNADFMIEDMMKRLGIKPKNWLEVKSEGSKEPPNKNLKYAVTHPHKIEGKTWNRD